MELTLNIDEKKFNDLIQGELDNFSEQEIHEICKEGFMKCLSNVDTFRSLFVEKDGYYNRDSYHANDLLREAAKKVDLDPLFTDFQKQVLEYLTEHHDDIIKQLMSDIFIAGFSRYLYNSEFMDAMERKFNERLNTISMQNEEKINNIVNNLR